MAVTVAGLVFLPNEDSENRTANFYLFLPFYHLISVFPKFPSFPFLPPQRHYNQVRLSSLNEQIGTGFMLFSFEKANAYYKMRAFPNFGSDFIAVNHNQSSGF